MPPGSFPGGIPYKSDTGLKMVSQCEAKSEETI